MGEAASYIVWSNEHRAFWRPERCGYTQRIEQAGRYTKADAEGICRNANYRSNSDLRSGTPPEIFMPAPEALDSLGAAIVALEAVSAIRPDNWNEGDDPEQTSAWCQVDCALALALGEMK